MDSPTITDALLGEHGVIYPQLARLTDAPFDSAETARARADQLAAGLATHAQIEDELLFVALEGVLGPDGGPLPVMRAEHEEVEATLQRLTEAADVRDAEALAARLATVAREHFAKEESVLFPMAEQLLGEETLRELGEQWAARRLPA